MTTVIEPAAKALAAPPSSETSRETSGRRDAEYNPYLAARRAWDERYGDLITRARNWRLAALLSSAAALAATAGVVRLATHSRVVPYVVAIDSLGRPVAAAPAEEASGANDGRLKRSALFTWVEQLRLVTTDDVAQRKAIDRVYDYVASGSQAQAFISDYYRADPPQKRAATETVGVDITSVLATSDQTYEVEWVETARDLHGQVRSTDHWKGAFTIAVSPPAEERLVRVNPLGIYVTNAHWSKVL